MKTKTLFLICFFAGVSVSAGAKTWNCGSPNKKDVVATLEGTTLTISGTGKMKDYGYKNEAPWYDQKAGYDPKYNITTVVIQPGVTGIGREAFNDRSDITSVTIPNSVTSIGGSAFNSCYRLTSVTIPNGVTSIEDHTFGHCGFASITIPSSVISIGDYAFVYNKKLTSITIPNSVLRIGMRTFWGCEMLTSITIPNSVTSIGDEAFLDCNSLTSVTVMSAKPPKISPDAFSHRHLIALRVPDDAVEAYRAAKVWNDFSMPQVEEHMRLLAEQATQKAEAAKKEAAEQATRAAAYQKSFTYFAKSYVEPRIGTWQKKGEFEKTADWQQRVNEATRKAMIATLTKEAEQSYIAQKSREVKFALSLGDYDADNEVFLITSDRFEKNMLVRVPIGQAEYFKLSWSKLHYAPQYFVENDQLALAEMAFTMPNEQVYKYSNRASLNYTVASVDYNFDPITIETDNAVATTKGNQTISTVKVHVGKADVDVNVPEGGASSDKTFAVIIANESYQKESQVEFAKNDGNIFKEYCLKTLGIPAKNVHAITDATLNNIRAEISWIAKVAQAYSGEATIVFYYAGHGIPDEQSQTAYLLPIDGYGSDVTTGYRLDDLYATLGGLPAKSVTVFMDACFSGAKRDGSMLAAARGVAIKTKPSAPSGKMVVFSAASGDETAYPYKEKGHGLFTYFLLKKLQESKGNITFGELSKYITTNVRQQSIVVNSKSQTPTVIPSAALGDGWENMRLR